MFETVTNPNHRLESVNQYREAAPLAPLVFNWSPTSLAESVIRHVPLREDCTGRPGRLLVSTCGNMLSIGRDIVASLTVKIAGLRRDLPDPALREGHRGYVRKPGRAS